MYGTEGLRYFETFTAARVGERLTVDSALPAFHAVSVVGVGGKLTSWTVLLEGSLDGTGWTTLLTHNTTEGSTVFDTNGAAKPVRYVRVNVTALSLGDASSAKVTAVCKA